MSATSENALGGQGKHPDERAVGGVERRSPSRSPPARQREHPLPRALLHGLVEVRADRLGDVAALVRPIGEVGEGGLEPVRGDRGGGGLGVDRRLEVGAGQLGDRPPRVPFEREAQSGRAPRRPSAGRDAGLSSSRAPGHGQRRGGRVVGRRLPPLSDGVAAGPDLGPELGGALARLREADGGVVADREPAVAAVDLDVEGPGPGAGGGDPEGQAAGDDVADLDPPCGGGCSASMRRAVIVSGTSMLLRSGAAPPNPGDALGTLLRRARLLFRATTWHRNGGGSTTKSLVLHGSLTLTATGCDKLRYCPYWRRCPSTSGPRRFGSARSSPTSSSTRPTARR